MRMQKSRGEFGALRKNNRFYESILQYIETLNHYVEKPRQYQVVTFYFNASSYQKHSVFVYFYSDYEQNVNHYYLQKN